MSKFTAFVIIIALRILYQPSGAEKNMAPFTSQPHSGVFATVKIPEKNILIPGKVIENTRRRPEPTFENELSGNRKNQYVSKGLTGIRRQEIPW